MDERTTEFIDTFQTFLRDMLNERPSGTDRLTPFGEFVEEFLGASVRELPVISHSVAAHRLVDADVALADLAAESHAEPHGITGGQQRDHNQLAELISNPYVRFAPGPVEYISIPDGPESTRRVMAFGFYALVFEGHPIVVLQRRARPDHGVNVASLEVITPSPDAATAFLAEFGERMLRLSVLRGQVLSFSGNEYGQLGAGATFLPRPTVVADDVILPPGVLESVVRHVVGIGDHRDRLVAAGQHLKRGVLLYGPPGTGKTLTVRHLLALTPGTTAVLLTGSSIQFVTQAAELARAMQPAIVVLEDVDLVAAERGMHGSPDPLLFSILDALDGLDGDADVTFLLTTNRVDVLERALAERPGRIDLAVEVPLPDDESRRRLFARYASGLPLSAPALDAAADRSPGTTGSFAKELVRRAVLSAAEQGREVTDADLASSLDSLLDSGAQLARNLLGGGQSDEEATSVSTTFGSFAPSVVVTRHNLT
ncbi:DNA polymerase III delta prime subunit [Conyzicola lurida]|uniref:DNA polymerase III delta prime subunit n=1 Tax=Conyzicola lurida TaxID=1172621 RepID=A0A841AQM4_9MICO|nr:DNA polymerase III delta prime subunit [Conyzicola lurida]